MCITLASPLASSPRQRASARPDLGDLGGCLGTEDSFVAPSHVLSDFDCNAAVNAHVVDQTWRNRYDTNMQGSEASS